MDEGDYSHSTTILIILNPNKQGTVLKSVSIGLIVRWCMGPVGQIDGHHETHHVHSFSVEGRISNPQTPCVQDILHHHG